MPSPLRIGVAGTFDVENFGDMLYPRIVRHEISARLPDAEMRVFAPFGYPGLNRFDAGEPAEPLGPWSDERCSELSSDLDCLLVGGGEILHTHDELLAPHYGVDPDELREMAPRRFFVDGLGPDREQTTPVVWNAVGIPFDPTPAEAGHWRAALTGRPYAAVRDEISLRRLRDAGVEREVAVVPDLAFVADRLFEPWLLEKRIGFLRATDAFPERGEAIVVQANRDYVEEAPAIAGALRELLDRREDASVVVAETGPCHGDGEFAEALAAELGGRARRLGVAGIEDLAAAIAGSGGFVGSSLHGNILAFVYGRPSVVLNFDGRSKLDEFGALVENPDCVAARATAIRKAFEYTESLGGRPGLREALRSRVDGHFDRIAGIATDAALRRGESRGERESGEPSPVAEDRDDLWIAYEALAGRLSGRRAALADAFDDLRRENAGLRRDLAAAREEIRAAEERLAGKEGEIRNLLNTRTFRYTAALRRLYGRIRFRGNPQ